MAHISHSSLDPYEEQLLRVFNRHDQNNSGSLDREGLLQLCITLQLEEQGGELIRLLMLNERKSCVSFGEFKEALLNLLGKMQDSRHHENKVEISSPEREVSPKYVYGSKKYGRRSRPKVNELSSTDQENETKSSPVQRSNSQSEVLTKKRKTNFKLTRCTSLPGNNKDFTNNAEFITGKLPSEQEIICTEEMLKEAWQTLGVGEDGYLNQTELVLVFDAIGLHKLADGIIKQLDVNNDDKKKKISFQDVLDVIQRDEIWLDVLTNPEITNLPPNSVNLTDDNDDLFPNSQTFQYVTLGPDGNGFMTVDSLIEMWENVGIHSPKELIHELGFNSRKININELANVLEKQTRYSLTDNNNSRSNYHQNPNIQLLQANLTLYRSEIRCLRNILEQLQAEREKLKLDVCEANNRATMLAQEVDENHIRMEQNTFHQVKLLEQRHAEILKTLSAQFGKDKEQLNLINQNLEEKISALESETGKLKNDLVCAQKYSLNIEKENQNLGGNILDLEKDKTVLLSKVELLETEKLRAGEIEREQSEILSAKLSDLTIENSELKDRNDEMESEIESLTNQVISMKSKNASSSTPTRNFNTLDQSMEQEEEEGEEENNISIIYDGIIGIGAKRRSETSPSKEINRLRMTDESPRLGKVRKFYKTRTPPGNLFDTHFTTSSESGFETESESLSTSNCDNDEIIRLQAKVAYLEQVLMQNNIPVPNNNEEQTVQLVHRVQQLEKLILDIKNKMKITMDKNDEKCANDNNCNNGLKFIYKTLSDLAGKINFFEEKSSQTDDFLNVQLIEDKVNKLEEENRVLTTKCGDLDDCVELLRNEYEKCEDYWQNKVDEERQLFESEQKTSGDKLNELLDKMREYEEQYANQDMVEDNRLPIIAETDCLEKQFMDLEQEFEEFKQYHGSELYKKNEEIDNLKERLNALELMQQEKSTQAQDEDERLLNKMKSFSSYVIENTNRYAEEMLPSTSSGSSLINWTETEDISNTSSSLPNTVGISTPCRPKRTRKHDKTIYMKKSEDLKRTESSSSLNQKNATSSASGEQTVVLPLSAFANIMSKNNYLEQRLRHLQNALKQQHIHNEQALHYHWQQFRGERAELRTKLKFCQDKLDQQFRICNEQLDKLHRNDLFVKDLYVENAYLFANVERLEKQCRMLAVQANNSSSSSV